MDELKTKKYPYRRMKVNGKCIDHHRLVMEQKLGRKLYPDELVHHKDEVKSNDDPDNLVVINRLHHGQIHVTPQFIAAREESRQYGEKSPWAKLTADQVRDMRQRYAAGETIASLARAFKISRRNIGRIINRQQWKHVA